MGVLLDKQYNGMAADIWSLAVVLMEVHCGVRILEQVLSLNLDESQGANGGVAHPDVAIPKGIRAFFENPDATKDLLEGNCLQELTPLLNTTLPLLEQMMHVNPVQRAKAADLVPVIGVLTPESPGLTGTAAD